MSIIKNTTYRSIDALRRNLIKLFILDLQKQFIIKFCHAFIFITICFLSNYYIKSVRADSIFDFLFDGEKDNDKNNDAAFTTNNREYSDNIINPEKTFYAKSEIFALDVRTGKKTVLEVSKELPASIYGCAVKLISCYIEETPYYFKQNQALIEVTYINDKSLEKIVHQEWLFSDYKGVSQPYCKKYAFSLKRCM